MIRLEPAPGAELLDDPAAEPHLVCASLRNIGRANRWFGGAAAVRYGLERAFAGGAPGARWTMVVVGTGMGDLPLMAAAWAGARGILLEPMGLERHTGAARMARNLGLPVVVGDAGAARARLAAHVGPPDHHAVGPDVPGRVAGVPRQVGARAPGRWRRAR